MCYASVLVVSIRAVDHEYFYAVNMADPKTLEGYLERAYRLGKEFSPYSADGKVSATSPRSHTPVRSSGSTARVVS